MGTIHPDDPSPIAEDIPISQDIDPGANEGYETNLAALAKVPEPYRSLISKYSILKAHCKKCPGDELRVTMNLVFFTVGLVWVFRRNCKLLFSLYTLHMIKYT